MPGAQDDFFQSGNDATAISGIQAFVEGLMGLDMKLPILKTLQVLMAARHSPAAVSWSLYAKLGCQEMKLLAAMRIGSPLLADSNLQDPLQFLVCLSPKTGFPAMLCNLGNVLTIKRDRASQLELLCCFSGPHMARGLCHRSTDSRNV